MTQEYQRPHNPHIFASPEQRRKDEKPTRRPVGIHERALRPRGDYQLPELPDFGPDDLWCLPIVNYSIDVYV